MQERYIRSLGGITEEECLALRGKAVFVAGCGGLGGYLIELLARLGVGEIRAADGDVFAESNLNRQLLSDESVLGENKAKIAARRVANINSDVRFTGIGAFFTEENGAALLAGCDLALDALDNIPARRLLARHCAKAGIPLVHGAVRDWYGQVTTLLPGSDVFDRLYPPGAVSGTVGCLPFTPALVAAAQAAEAAKLLLGREDTLVGRLLVIDILSHSYETIEI